METKSKTKLFNILSLVFGGWFLLTSWVWFWVLNFFFSFPAGVVGIIFWMIARRDETPGTLNKFALWIHLMGVLSAIVSYFVMMR